MPAAARKSPLDGHSYNRQVRVAGRADGIPDRGIFAVENGQVPELPPGGAIVRVLYAAVDPGMRGWLSAERNYMTVPTGEIMRAHGVGEILASDHPNWKAGDHVYGWLGWQQLAAVAASDILWKIDLSLAPAAAWLGVLGLNGLTAWIGLHQFAHAREGDVMLVSTAAGAVGGVVGQLARAGGIRAIGLTGSDAKVREATEKLGYETAINYRDSNDLATAIAAAAPDGITIFFDNTAGALADAVFPQLSPGARVVQCGTASVASWLPTPLGPRRERDMLVKRLSWHGFVVTDHQERFSEVLPVLGELYKEGALTARTHVLDGLDQAPDALGILYRGENDGRLVIRP